MKKITLLVTVLFVAASFVNAQSTKEEVDLMQASFGMEKKPWFLNLYRLTLHKKMPSGNCMMNMKLPAKLWDRKGFNFSTIILQNMTKFTNESADTWTKNVIDLSKATDDLIITYYNKIKKVTNPIVALQFYQVEGYILSGIRVSLLESLPLPDLK